MRAMVLAVVVLWSGCFLGPSRGQRTAGHVFNAAFATLGGAMIAVTAIDKSSERDDSSYLQIHPDLYAAGSVLIGCAVLGTILNIFAPRSSVAGRVAGPTATRPK
jgi:hypothetical protein